MGWRARDISALLCEEGLWVHTHGHMYAGSYVLFFQLWSHCGPAAEVLTEQRVRQQQRVADAAFTHGEARTGKANGCKGCVVL